MQVFSRTANRDRLRRRIERLRRALYDAYERGEALNGECILSLSDELDRLLNEYCAANSGWTARWPC